jgi:protoporphyrinogen oxidase
LFFRPTEEELETLGDAAWRERAERAVAVTLGAAKGAERVWVSRWPRALGLYDQAHQARVAALEHALEGSRILLAGAAFQGAGIDAAVRSGFRAGSVSS